MTQVVEILSYGWQKLLNTVNTVAADELAMKQAKVSAAMVSSL